VEEQASASNEIALSVSQAADGGANIAARIDEVALVAQTSASGAGQVQEAAQSLARMASGLQDFVSLLQI
jgi:methyl-accepting chemotaxis protein